MIDKLYKLLFYTGLVSLILIPLFFVFLLFYSGPDLSKYDTKSIKSEAAQLYADQKFGKGFIDELSDNYPYLKSTGAIIHKSELGVQVTLWEIFMMETGFMFFGTAKYADEYGGIRIGYEKVDDMLYSFKYID